MSNSINHGLQYLESLKCTFISPAKNLFRTRTLICNLSESFLKKLKNKRKEINEKTSLLLRLSHVCTQILQA